MFRSLLSDSTHHLKSLSKRLGSCIEKARPYYEALDQMTRAQAECQKAAVQFQRSAGIHAAAKETISLAEERFLDNSGEWQFDNAWQEMLNHATIKARVIINHVLQTWFSILSSSVLSTLNSGNVHFVIPFIPVFVFILN